MVTWQGFGSGRDTGMASEQSPEIPVAAQIQFQLLQKRNLLLARAEPRAMLVAHI